MQDDFSVSKEPRLWWLASYPKSGSTWVRMFLTAYVTGWPVDLNSPWQYVIGDHSPRLWQMTMAKPLGDLTTWEMPLYRPAVLANAIQLCPTQDLALKTHHANVALDDLRLIPPGLTKGAVYVVRDPRSIALSFADHMGVEVDTAIGRMADNAATIHDPRTPGLQHVLMSWSTHVDSWTVQNRTIRTQVIRYEDLLADPERIFRQIVDAFGLPLDESRLRFAVNETRFDRLKSIEAKTGFRERSAKSRDGFFRRARGLDWHRDGPDYARPPDEEEVGSMSILEEMELIGPAEEYLTAAQRRRIAEHHQHTMQRFDYATEES